LRCDYGDAELGRNAEATALSQIEPHTGPPCRMDQQAIIKGGHQTNPWRSSPLDLTSKEGKHARISVNPSESGYHSNNSSTCVTASN
jgi:hypothetical protein